jgi:hypothetical protein
MLPHMHHDRRLFYQTFARPDLSTIARHDNGEYGNSSASWENPYHHKPEKGNSNHADTTGIQECVGKGSGD